MRDQASRVRSRKRLLTGITVSTVALSRAAFPLKVHASPSTYDWTQHATHDLMGGYYTSVASSADGSHLIVGSAEGGEGYNQASPLYVSVDYGTTWENVTENADNRIRDYWRSVDVTDDGLTMVAASDTAVDLSNLATLDGKIVITHDSGSTWTDITPDGIHEWQATAISGDGNRIVAVANDDLDHVYVSENGGNSWQIIAATENLRYWSSVSISDNGEKVLIGGENTTSSTSVVLVSTNGGDTWQDQSPDNGDLVFKTRTAMSSTGDKMLVSTDAWNGANEYDAVYESTDDGANWTSIGPNDGDISAISGVAISDDGSVLSAVDSTDKLFLSYDNGATWAEEDPDVTGEASNSWRAADFNASGSRIIAASSTLAYSGHNASLDEPEAPTVELADPESGKAITLTTPSGTTITCHTPVKESGLTAQDGVYAYPLGLVDFCFSGAGESNDIILTFVTDLKPTEVTARKFNPTTNLYATVTEAVITETTLGGHHALQVTYPVVDNGPLDTDSDDGEIADPIGLAVADVKSPNTGLGHNSKNLIDRLFTPSDISSKK